MTDKGYDLTTERLQTDFFIELLVLVVSADVTLGSEVGAVLVSIPTHAGCSRTTGAGKLTTCLVTRTGISAETAQYPHH